MADPAVIESAPPVQLPDYVSDADQPAYRYAVALSQSARANAKPYVDKFKGYWDFLLGKGHWRSPATKSARALEDWQFRGIVNDLWAVHDTKRSIIAGAPSKVSVEPLDENSEEYERAQVKAAVDQDLERQNFVRVRRDVYDWGGVCGIGIAMHELKPDALTGEMRTCLTAINPAEFFWDPNEDTIETCQFVVWEPILPMSVVRKMFPEKAKFVRSDDRAVPGGPTITYTTPNDSNLLLGPSGEYVADTNSLKQRRAKVCFVWIKDEEVIEEVRETIVRGEVTGYACESCGSIMDPEQGDYPEGENCPNCGGDLNEVRLPPRVNKEEIRRRAYPYGRLTVYSGKTLLYDGENPLELTRVFPFYAYHHYRLPGVFPGFGDVSLLKSIQEEMNTTVGQGIDYVRLAVNAPTIYPVTFKSITDLGNGPNERLPGPPSAQWLPYRLGVTGFDTQTWNAVLNTLERKFNTISGISPLGLGQTSSPPISATEAELSVQGPSQRMKNHATEFALFSTHVAQGTWELLQQIGVERRVQVRMPDGSGRNLPVEPQSYPRIKVQVSIDLEEATLDKLHSQVLQGFIAQGGLQNPDADIFLEELGVAPARIKELMRRKALHGELAPPGTPPPGSVPQPQGGIQ